MVGEEAQAGTDMAITAYGTPLSSITSFKYLGRVLSAAGDDWLMVFHNIWRAHQKVEQLSRVLSREGAYARALVIIYVVVLQTVILYGSETWVMTSHIRRVLG